MFQIQSRAFFYWTVLVPELHERVPCVLVGSVVGDPFL
jgi:hypothetical protein